MNTRLVLLGTGTPNACPDANGPSSAVVVGDRAYLVDFVAGFIGLLKAVDPKIDISLISLQDMASHVIQPLRAKYL